MFYINPPRGQVALHVLENCVFTRFQYLRLLDKGKTARFTGNSEYLLEYSSSDKIGHFILRLIALTSEDLWPFWIKTETLLFEQRLNASDFKDAPRIFKSIQKNLGPRGFAETPVSKSLMEMSKFFLTPEIYAHVSAQRECLDSCQKYEFQVPFEAVADLIAERKIDLHGGNASIPCSMWKTVLVVLYKNFLRGEKKYIYRPDRTIAKDPRLSYISERILGQKIVETLSSGGITARNIDEESKKFPLCMQNLHRLLRKKHRLGHHERFNYTIFLKDCGMKYGDALSFWREEYTKEHTCRSGCTHNWQKDSKKFIYSIRYMYGMEGGRKNYTTPPCSSICKDVPCLRYEGGCPFKNFDRSRLVELMSENIDESDIEDLTNKPMPEKPQLACSDFFKIAYKLDDFQESLVDTPVEYFAKATRFVD